MTNVIMPERTCWEVAVSADQGTARDRIRLSPPERDTPPVDREVHADLLARLYRLPPGHPSSLPDVRGGDRHSGTRPREEREEAGDRRPPQAPDGGAGYWDKVPGFERRWADHTARWPDGPAGARDQRGSTADPPGSWRGPGGQYLSPDQHAAVGEIITGTRDAERRISADLRAVERENAGGGRLAGWQFRLKGAERLKEKIAAEVGITPALEPSSAMRKVHDAIRYTFCAPADSYASTYRSVTGLLSERGYTMVYSKNHWRDDPEYKGINTRWRSADGDRFEVQFHTPESLHAKQQVTHPCYERIRDPATGRPERRELEAFQRDVSAAIPVPGATHEIPDQQEDG